MEALVTYLSIELIAAITVVVSVGAAIAVIFDIHKKASIAIRVSPQGKIVHDFEQDAAMVSYLTPYQTSQSIDAMAEWLKSQKPDFIIGVHTGGRLTSVLAAEKAGIPKEKLIYVSSDRIRPETIQFHLMGNNRLSGRIVVIDDISRKGTTLRQVSNRLMMDMHEKKNDIVEVLFATLATVVTPNKAQQGYIAPNFTYLKTQLENLTLPWSPLAAKIRDALDTPAISRDSQQKHFAAVRDSLVSNTEYSTYCAKLAISDKSHFDELVERADMRSKFQKPTSF